MTAQEIMNEKVAERRQGILANIRTQRLAYHAKKVLETFNKTLLTEIVDPGDIKNLSVQNTQISSNHLRLAH